MKSLTLSSPAKEFFIRAFETLTGYMPAELRNKFIDVLGEHYKTARDIGYYADKLCITAKHLSQVVKEVTGQTALEIIEEYVLTECKALLLSTTMSIQEISDELNFPSQSVFGKYFKRLTGMSPNGYRKHESQ